MIRHALIFWITTALAVWGLMVDIMARGLMALSIFILPLILLGLLYYAYKVAPGRMGGGPGRPRTKVKPSAKTMSKVAADPQDHWLTGQAQKLSLPGHRRQ